MGKIKNHRSVKYFSAITFSDESLLPEVFDKLTTIFGEIESKSDVFKFSLFTDYYKSEMGEELDKQFISFSDLALPDKLPEFKAATNILEQNFLTNSRRQVNIDPGYLTEAKIVLATTKDYSHRLYLQDGIFGDLHLYFENGSFNPQIWTYPDYKQPISLSFFNKLRIRYRKQLGELLY